MAHAGFPNGVGYTIEKIEEKIAGYTVDTHLCHIIELDGVPIGEMNYRNVGDNTAELGINICDFSQQNKGYGTVLLVIFINALFNYYGYEKVILDTNLKNKRAQHFYEKKIGFSLVRVREHDSQNQLGEWQTFIDYELKKQDWKHSPVYEKY